MQNIPEVEGSAHRLKFKNEFITLKNIKISFHIQCH